MFSPPILRNDSQSELIEVKVPSIENRVWPQVAAYGNSIPWTNFDECQKAGRLNEKAAGEPPGNHFCDAGGCYKGYRQ
jgi:hypothetical protein